MNRYKELRFSLEEIMKLVAEFIEERQDYLYKYRDVTDWFRWLERKHGLGPSRITKARRRK